MGALCAVAVPLAAPAARADTTTTTPLDVSFSGTFSLDFTQAPPLLKFSGSGTGITVGSASVVGQTRLGEADDTDAARSSRTRSLSPQRTAAGSVRSTPRWTASAGTHISGSGTFEVVGGKGRFTNATGSGTVRNFAVITGGAADGSAVSGTFSTLTFQGLVTQSAMPTD